MRPAHGKARLARGQPSTEGDYNGLRQKHHDEESAETTPPALIAWAVVERGEKKFWNRIGAAWEHEDGDGLSLHLDLFPVTGGRIVLRAPKQEQEEEGV